MQVRVTFVVSGVEVEIVTEHPSEIMKAITDVAAGVKKALAVVPIAKAPEITVEVGKPITLAGGVRDRIPYLANQIGTDETRLKGVIHFGDDYPVLIQNVPGTARAEQQRRALLILGAVLDLVYEKPEVGATLYGEILRKSNVPEQRLDLAMAGLRGRFILKGAGRGSSYEITVPGRNEGLAALRELVTLSAS